jgi:hypothetical protein
METFPCVEYGMTLMDYLVEQARGDEKKKQSVKVDELVAANATLTADAKKRTELVASLRRSVKSLNARNIVDNEEHDRTKKKLKVTTDNATALVDALKVATDKATALVDGMK